jgi:predicted RNase H-like HicB family nuclease
MLTKYLQAAMKRAKYEILPEDKTYYGEIPGFQGVYANSDTLEGCREELQEVLEGWVMLSLAKNLPMPVVDGIDVNVKQAA